MNFEGHVHNGVIVLDNGHQLADGTCVEVIVREAPETEAKPIPAPRLTPAELRRLPREQRQAILAAAAAMAEQDYHSDNEVIGFEVPTGQAELVVTVDPHDADREKARAAALDQFLTLARSSSFCSAGLCPTRDDLHERD